ncbi:unnamed protein product [Gadus morhua 'NCC']
MALVLRQVRGVASGAGHRNVAHLDLINQSHAFLSLAGTSRRRQIIPSHSALVLRQVRGVASGAGHRNVAHLDLINQSHAFLFRLIRSSPVDYPRTATLSGASASYAYPFLSSPCPLVIF